MDVYTLVTFDVHERKASRNLADPGHPLVPDHGILVAQFPYCHPFISIMLNTTARSI